jgi:hypothetical protein
MTQLLTHCPERKQRGRRIPFVIAAFLCAAQIVGGTSVVGVKAWPRVYEAPYWNPADAIVWTGASAKLFWVHAASPGVYVSRSSCAPTKARVPLAPAGLPKVAHFTDREYPTVRIRCPFLPKVLLRYAVSSGDRNLPVHAAVALRTPAGKQLAYVEWSWTSVTAWASPRCETTTPSQGLGPP